MVSTTIRDAFGRWKGALVDQAKQTTRAAPTALTRASPVWKT